MLWVMFGPCVELCCPDVSGHGDTGGAVFNKLGGMHAIPTSDVAVWFRTHCSRTFSRLSIFHPYLVLDPIPSLGFQVMLQWVRNNLNITMI